MHCQRGQHKDHQCQEQQGSQHDDGDTAPVALHSQASAHSRSFRKEKKQSERLETHQKETTPAFSGFHGTKDIDEDEDEDDEDEGCASSTVHRGAKRGFW